MKAVVSDDVDVVSRLRFGIDVDTQIPLGMAKWFLSILNSFSSPFVTNQHNRQLFIRLVEGETQQWWRY